MTRAALLLLCGTVALMAPLIHAWGSSNNKDRVLLEKVSALTLEQGRMTTGRRTSPVQQLKCVGGSAGCSYGNQPRVVQCLNKGFDGYDVQWECKAELDSKYQFGKIQVSCEGYEYPDDPYILRGSCGLEYELDLTQQGEQRGSDYHGNHHGDHHYNNHYSGSPNYYRGGGWSWGGLIMLAIVGFIIYRVLRAFCGRANAQRYGTAGATSNTGSGSQSYSSPPPSNAGGTGGGLGGFWTGAATGGALGYLFGNRGGGYGYGGGYGGGYSRGHSTGYRSTGWGSRSGGFGGSGFGGGGFGGGGGGFSSRSSGSSSRSSSGYGGTSRR